jgi:CRISPR-associated protein Cas6
VAPGATRRAGTVAGRQRRAGAAADGQRMANEMIDVVCDVSGGSVQADHALALFVAIAGILPWFAATRDVGVHPLRGAVGTQRELLLARRAKLVLRVPETRADDCRVLAGRELVVGARSLVVGRTLAKPLRPSPTLCARRVATTASDARSFEEEVATALYALGISRPFISGCAREDWAGARPIAGFGLAVHGLGSEDSLHLQARGIGPDRELGWGIFVPARSITTAA